MRLSAYAALALSTLIALGARAEEAPPDGYAPARPFVQAFTPEAAPAPAPQTPILDAGGGETRLSAWRGAPAVVVLWATWCPVCREEMPRIAAAAPEIARAGAALAPVSVDAGPDAPAKVARHLERELLDDLPALVDSGQALAQAVGLRALTTILFLDAEGRIAGRIEGRAPWDDPALFAYLRDLAGAAEAGDAG